MIGNFKRNLFEKEKFFVNPLDDTKQQQAVIDRLLGIRQQKAAESMKK